jgi:hypothetical protein
MIRGLRVFFALALTVVGGSAWADGVDVDYDAILNLLDGVEQAIADTKPEVSDSDIILLYGRDRDANGINDEDQLAMLSAILMGQYTVESNVYGTVQLDPAVVSAIQAGFVANKNRVNTDLVLEDDGFGSPCFLLGLAGQSCNIGDLIAQGNAETKDGILNLLAGYMTLGETGITNYNGTGQDFVETYFENLLEIALRATDFAQYADDINSDLAFNPNNYQRFGSAAAVATNNRLGAAGNIDANTGSITTNGEEYTATANREEWLNACHITPPMRVVTSPEDATKNTGDSHTLSATSAGGLFGLGLGVTQSKWSTVATVDNVTVVTLVRPLAPGTEYPFPYLTLPVGVPTQATTYVGSIEDGIWKRSTESAVLTIDLDTNFRISAQPTGGEYADGAPVTLSVSVAGGNLVPAYQWRLDTVTIEGATSATYEFPALAGSYDCVITGNTDGAAKAVSVLTSDPAVITIGAGEGEGLLEGEGVAEGEGQLEGEGAVEGIVEGVVEGEGEGIVEGVVEGEGEGIVEGVLEGEGISEGEGALEGEGINEGEGALEGEGTAEGEGDDGSLCTVLLTPGQVSPPTNTSASGTLRVFDGVDGGLLYVIEHSVADPTSASVRLGSTCANGNTVLPIANATSPININLTGAQVAQLEQLGSAFYIVVRSATYPDGEIRGVFGCPDVSDDDVLCPGGEGEQEGTLEGEGIVEGETEGVVEGALEGEGIAEGEGSIEGVVEGEGGVEGEGQLEGEGEGLVEGDPCADHVEGEIDVASWILSEFFALDVDQSGKLSVEEVYAMVHPCVETAQYDYNEDGLLQVSELLAASGDGDIHSSDTDGTSNVTLDELLRVIQMFNAGGYACALNPGATEDGYLPGTFNFAGRDLDCRAHASDYVPAGGDGAISLSELLRLIQIYNVGEYRFCLALPSSEDNFCLDALK